MKLIETYSIDELTEMLQKYETLSYDHAKTAEAIKNEIDRRANMEVTT